MRIHKDFFHYVIPSMLAFALSGIYAIADGFFVGNALGDNALAAINVAYPLTAFLQAVGTGIGMGGAIRYAISKGNQNDHLGQQYFGMSLLLLDVYKRQVLDVLPKIEICSSLHPIGAAAKIHHIEIRFQDLLSAVRFIQV